MESCPPVGSIIVEYYDGSSDFSESEDSEVSNVVSHPLCEVSSTDLVERDEVEFKTYDFKHQDTECCSDSENDGAKFSRNSGLFPQQMKQTMNEHYIITHQEQMNNLLHPKASFLRCPRGGTADTYCRRSYPGPFLTCPIGHECGDEFVKVPISTKPLPELDLSTRPRHLKERKARFFKQCKNCETIAFTHHRNTAQHYQDYLNNVTYKQHRNHTKVWPQHLADLRHVLEESGLEVSSEVATKCKDFVPSIVVPNAVKNQFASRRKRSAVIIVRKPVFSRMSRRPSKTNTLKSPSSVEKFKDQPEGLVSINKKNSGTIAQNNGTPKVVRQNRDDKIYTSTRKITISPRTTQKVTPRKQSIQMQSSTDSSSSDSEKHFMQAKTSVLHRRLKTPIAKIIKSRQAPSKISKQFVKKPEPPKESKYIPKLKPNISAKFLRNRSKSKLLSATNTTYINQTNVRKRSGKAVIKVSKKPIHKQNSFNTKFLHSNDNSSEDGSYAQFRDINGNFDTDKYRQSILKMLDFSNSKRRERKKKRTKLRRSQVDFVALPSIKNLYGNTKPKITSNAPKRKMRASKKLDTSLELSDTILKSNFYLRNHVVDNNESLFLMH